MRREDLALTHHALAAYRIFYPSASERDVWEAMLASVDVPFSVGHRLRGKGYRRDNDSGSYLLHPERSGLFIIEGTAIVTFLRFYSATQRDLAEQLYPGGKTPTCEGAPWYVAPPPVPTVCGETLDRVAVSKGARKALGGLEAALEVLPRLEWGPTPILTPEVCVEGEIADPVGRAEHDGTELLACDYSGGVYVCRYTVQRTPAPRASVRPVSRPEPRPIPWLDEVSTRDVRVARPVLEAIAGVLDTPAERRRVRDQVREDLATQPEPPREGGAWRPLIEGRRWWLAALEDGAGDPTEWWVLPHPPIRWQSDHEEAAELLRGAGWVVVPPRYDMGRIEEVA